MVDLVFVRTGDKYEEWYEKNLIYMAEKFGKLKIDNIIAIREGEGAVYDKLKMFDICTENKFYIYFDLDVVIKGDVNHLIRDDFTTLFAWWRDRLHTPLNSSIPLL